MKNIFLLIFTICFLSSANLISQSDMSTYEITITTKNSDGEKEVKKMVFEDEDLSQEEIDAIIEEKLAGYDGEIDVNVNVSKLSSTTNEETEAITKIIKKRSHNSTKEKVIIEEQNMEFEIIDDKAYLNGEELQDGISEGKMVRVFRFSEGEENEMQDLIGKKVEQIEAGEKVFVIERKSLGAKESTSSAFLGTAIEMRDNLLMISEVIPNSSAEKFDLKRGSYILSLNNIPIRSTQQFTYLIKTFEPGDIIELEIMEEVGESEIVEVELGSSMSTKQRSWNDADWEQKRRKRNWHSQRFDKAQVEMPNLGVRVQTIDDKVVVSSIMPDSGAEEAGVIPGDEIVQVDKMKIFSANKLIRVIKSFEVGDIVDLTYRRGKKLITKQAELKSKSGNQKMQQRPENIERIIIKKRDEDRNRINERESFERSGAFKLRSFDLTPNPSNGIINIDFEMDPFENDEVLYTRIISLDGKILKEERLDEFDGRYIKEYDLSDEGAGIYLFQIEKNEQKFTKRFVIENNN